MPKRTICVTPVLLTFASIPTIAMAQPQEAVVEEVIVTASRMAKPESTIPNTVSIVDEELITLQSAVDDTVTGILSRTVPGFAPSSQKMSGGAETLRGKNALLMIDGVPQHNSLRDGLRDGFTIDSDFLERIEVIQGANAVQGIGATGGVVNLITRSAQGGGEWNNTVKARMTSNDKFDGNSMGHKLTYIGDIVSGDLDAVVGVAWHERGIFYDADNRRIGYRTAQGELQDSESRDFYAKLGYSITDAQRIQLMLNDYELENNGKLENVPGDRDAGIYATSRRNDTSDIYGEPAKNDVATLSLDYSHDDLFGGKLLAQLYFQDYEALFEGSINRRWALTPGGPAILDQSQIESEKFGIKLSYEYRVLAGIDGLRTMFGLDYATDESMQTLPVTGRVWVPKMNLIAVSPFMQLEYKVGDNLLLAAGLRHENATLDVDDFVTLPSENSTFVQGGEPDYKELLSNVGVVYNLTDALAVYASYAEGFDMADVGRILRAIDVPGLDVDDFIDLEPVITENKEIGLNYDAYGWSAQLSYYWSDTDLGSRLKDDNGIYVVKREKQEIEGYDIIVSYEVSNQLMLGMNYAHVEGQYDADGDGSVDTDMSHNNQAPDRLNVFAMGNWGAVSGKLQISRLEDRTQKGLRAATDERAVFEGFTLVDLSLAYDSRVGTFGLGIQNLLDKEYETLYSQYQNRDDRYFSGRGRTVSLSYELNF